MVSIIIDGSLCFEFDKIIAKVPFIVHIILFTRLPLPTYFPITVTNIFLKIIHKERINNP
jgi:hypothetical protein